MALTKVPRPTSPVAASLPVAHHARSAASPSPSTASDRFQPPVAAQTPVNPPVAGSQWTASTVKSKTLDPAEWVEPMAALLGIARSIRDLGDLGGEYAEALGGVSNADRLQDEEVYCMVEGIAIDFAQWHEGLSRAAASGEGFSLDLERFARRYEVLRFFAPKAMERWEPQFEVWLRRGKGELRFAAFEETSVATVASPDEAASREIPVDWSRARGVVEKALQDWKSSSGRIETLISCHLREKPLQSLATLLRSPTPSLDADDSARLYFLLRFYAFRASEDFLEFLWHAGRHSEFARRAEIARRFPRISVAEETAEPREAQEAIQSLRDQIRREEQRRLELHASQQKVASHLQQFRSDAGETQDRLARVDAHLRLQAFDQWVQKRREWSRQAERLLRDLSGFEKSDAALRRLRESLIAALQTQSEFLEARDLAQAEALGFEALELEEALNAVAPVSVSDEQSALRKALDEWREEVRLHAQRRAAIQFQVAYARFYDRKVDAAEVLAGFILYLRARDKSLADYLQRFDTPSQQSQLSKELGMVFPDAFLRIVRDYLDRQVENLRFSLPETAARFFWSYAEFQRDPAASLNPEVWEAVLDLLEQADRADGDFVSEFQRRLREELKDSAGSEFSKAFVKEVEGLILQTLDMTRRDGVRFEVAREVATQTLELARLRHERFQEGFHRWFRLWQAASLLKTGQEELKDLQAFLHLLARSLGHGRVDVRGASFGQWLRYQNFQPRVAPSMRELVSFVSRLTALFQ